MPRANARRPDLLHALTVAAIAAGAHFAWALLPLPALPPPPTPPRVSYTALTETRPLLASPILFSLPSSLGFSSVALQQRTRILPPLNSPLDLALHTPIPRQKAAPDPHPTPQSLHPHPPPLRHSLPLPPPALPGTARWQIRALSGQPDTPTLQMFRPPPPPETRQARHVTGVIQFNEFGQVDTLLVDPAPTRPGPDILHALRLIRIPLPSAPARIPFELHFQPADARP